jgi:serine/threonine protein phosphatase 1
MKTFVIGDIHGAYKALMQCLELSQFDPAKDSLICLGDVCDRGVQVKECIDVLMAIPRCVYILGNHDAWALNWAMEGKVPVAWIEQGGDLTIASYLGKPMPGAHMQFLSDAKYYYIYRNKLFVHGGFDAETPLEKTQKEVFLWDRGLLTRAREIQPSYPDYKFGTYDEVFVGHTPTISFGKTEPKKFCNVWALDTGAGWGAPLTIMDVDTHEFWQSDGALPSFGDKFQGHL